jgi:hypothetical protein
MERLEGAWIKLHGKNFHNLYQKAKAILVQAYIAGSLRLSGVSDSSREGGMVANCEHCPPLSRRGDP